MLKLSVGVVFADGSKVILPDFESGDGVEGYNRLDREYLPLLHYLFVLVVVYLAHTLHL